MHKRIELLCIGILFMLVPVFGQPNDKALENLAAQIAEKRSEVESLSNKLDLLKSDYNEKLRSLATQKADVETQIKREELQLAQLDQDMEEFLTRIQDNRASMKEIKPIVSDVLKHTKGYIKKGLPFQVTERLNEIDLLERLLEEKKLDEGNILARVWNTLEAEFRLCQESGLYRQTIEVEGESQIAEVARLGMALMYFKTMDDHYGYTVPKDGVWEYHYAKGRSEQEQIAELFDSLRKNLREGYFVLPNPGIVQQTGTERS